MGKVGTDALCLCCCLVILLWSLVNVSAFSIRPRAIGLRQAIHRAKADANTVLYTSENRNTESSTTSNSHNITIVDHSTLTLLEHISLNVPTLQYAMPFYYEILGCGVDPRMAHNLHSHPNATLDATMWANCGASQFHICYNDQLPARLPGRIGLRYDSLQDLQHRLDHHILTAQSQRCFQSYLQDFDSQGNLQITIVDRYNNVFVCRQLPAAPTDKDSQQQQQQQQQPIVCQGDQKDESWDKELVDQYARTDATTDCRGIDYVEIPVPLGTADKIATFYESVFDATTHVVPYSPLPTMTTTTTTNTDKSEYKIAMIAVGAIQSNGRATQYLLFKEQDTSADASDPGQVMYALPQRALMQHHICLYVGETMDDFEQAYRNAAVADVVWINPRFDDKVDSLQAAKQWNQFRLQNIVDLETGDPIFQLEHELRSIQHPSFPGRATPT